MPVGANAKSLLLWFLKLAVSAVLLTYALRSVSFQQLGRALADTTGLLVILAYLVDQVIALLQVVRWGVLLQTCDIQLGFLARWRAVFIGHLFNIFLPTTMGGDVMRFAESGVPRQQRMSAAATILVERYLGFYAMLWIAVFCIYMSPAQITPELRVFAWAPVILVALMTVGLVLVGRGKPIASGESVKGGRFRRLFLAGRLLAQNPRRMAKAFGLSLVAQGLNYVSIYLLVRALGMSIPVATFMLFMSLMMVATLLPISIGGLGVREAAFLFFFLKVGYAREQILSLSTLAFSRLIVLALVGVLVYCLVRNRRVVERKEKMAVALRKS